MAEPRQLVWLFGQQFPGRALCTNYGLRVVPDTLSNSILREAEPLSLLRAELGLILD